MLFPTLCLNQKTIVFTFSLSDCNRRFWRFCLVWNNNIWRKPRWLSHKSFQSNWRIWSFYRNIVCGGVSPLGLLHNDCFKMKAGMNNEWIKAWTTKLSGHDRWNVHLSQIMKCQFAYLSWDQKLSHFLYGMYIKMTFKCSLSKV